MVVVIDRTVDSVALGGPAPYSGPAQRLAAHRISLRRVRDTWLVAEVCRSVSRPGDPIGRPAPATARRRRPGPRSAPRPGRPGPAPRPWTSRRSRSHRASRNADQSSTSVVASSADDTSSASSSSASQASARASARRCTWPPDSRTPRWPTSASGPPASATSRSIRAVSRAGSTSRSAVVEGDVAAEGARQHARHLGHVGDPSGAAGRPRGRRGVGRSSGPRRCW